MSPWHWLGRSVLKFWMLTAASAAFAQADSSAMAPADPAAVEPDRRFVEPAQRAFEEGRWEDAIAEYRELLAAYPEDRLSRLRIAQAERELGRYAQALVTLEEARAAEAPESMVDLERARSLALLGRRDEALAALDVADHSGLRALGLLDDARELDPLRAETRFQNVYRNVRARVFPCEALAEAGDFDFWLGRWEVRLADGTLLGENAIRKTNGGCSIEEAWQGAGASTGTSMSYFLPSRGEWRQVWTGSGGTFFDITGRLVDGVMRMEGTLEYVAPNRVVAFRGTWTRSADGRVRQRLEEFDVTAAGWVVWFDGFYRRLD